jgi:hypothetical protein
VARVAIALVWIPVASELFLRILAPVPLLPRYVIAAPYGVRANQPGITYYHTTPDVHVRMTINSKGLRADREIPYQKTPGVARIVALGDSFGMGYEVDLKDMFLSVMERRLNEAGHPCEVVNLSVSGHGNAEELIALQEEGFRYQPDLVIVSWHETDLVDNVRSKLFRLDESGQLVRDASTYLPGTATQAKLAQYGLYRWLSENCQLYSFVRETVAGKIKDLLASRRSLPTAPASKPGSEEAPGEKAPPASSLTSAQKLTVALMHRMQAECRDHGAEFLVLELPAGSERTSSRSFPKSPRGDEFGLRIVNLVPSFLQHSDQQLYWKRGHFHLTPLGCRLAGEALSRAILEGGLLDRPRPAATAGL